MNKEILKFSLKGDFAHFKIPYTNNNPLTYSFIPKTALMGLIGAVNGIERNDMKELFPRLCDGIMYSIKFNKPLKKTFIPTTTVNLDNYGRPDRENKVPKSAEYLKTPNWTVYLMVNDNDVSLDVYEKFKYNIKNDIYFWQPTLGTKQCKAIIDDVEILDGELKNGTFKTKTFVENVFGDAIGIVHSDIIPTLQNNDWVNEKYTKVFFKDDDSEIESTGNYILIKDENIHII